MQCSVHLYNSVQLTVCSTKDILIANELVRIASERNHRQGAQDAHQTQIAAQQTQAKQTPRVHNR